MNVQRTLILIFLISNLSYAQDSKYRIQASFGLFSIMNPGTKSFDGVFRNDDDNLAVYKTEIYDIDYKNFTFSSGFHFKLGFNWIQKKKFSIRQTSSIAVEIYKEQIHFTLVDIGDGSTDVYQPYYGESVVKLGYHETAVASGAGFVFTQEIIYLRNSENISWGGGISHSYRSRNDWNFNRNIAGVYVPNDRILSYGQYETHQLGFVFHLEKVFTRSMIYLNLNQQFVTVKKQKGAKYFQDGNELNPISHNMDFRFPLLIQFGGSIQFGKNKK